MKKTMIILSLALLIALPVFGLAADAASPALPETQTAAPLGGQYGRRWTRNTPGATAPQNGYLDADQDGLCDSCGKEQGRNAAAPNYIDENKDGVCDHFGTAQQGQGQGRAQGLMGRSQQGPGGNARRNVGRGRR